MGVSGNEQHNSQTTVDSPKFVRVDGEVGYSECVVGGAGTDVLQVDQRVARRKVHGHFVPRPIHHDRIVVGT